METVLPNFRSYRIWNIPIRCAEPQVEQNGLDLHSTSVYLQSCSFASSFKCLLFTWWGNRSSTDAHADWKFCVPKQNREEYERVVITGQSHVPCHNFPRKNTKDSWFPVRFSIVCLKVKAKKRGALAEELFNFDLKFYIERDRIIRRPPGCQFDMHFVADKKSTIRYIILYAQRSLCTSQKLGLI